jgi:ATP-binding cassette subfamily F protein 3
MPILTAQNLHHAYGAHDILQNIQLKLEAKERVGLVGPNGVGKTTLLLILAGLLEPDKGEVTQQAGLTMGYLRQEAVLTFAGQGNTIYEEMLSVFSQLTAQENQLRQMEEQMAARDLSPELFDQYGELQQQYEAQGGYEYQIDIKRVLLGLGFPEEMWQTPLLHLSGGQKTRLLLGRLLLEKRDLLILDEPTNHLDSAAVEWLEKTLRQWPGTLLIVSHDRYFLDKVTTHIWDLRPDKLLSYKGNYSSYVQQRHLLWERDFNLFTQEKERLEKELEFVRRNIAGGNSDIAKGKLKRLTRDLVLIEEVGVLEMQGKSWLELGGRVRTLTVAEATQKLSALLPPANKPPTLNIKLISLERSGKTVLKTSPLKIGYPGRELFTTEKILLERQDCVALLGPNGSGKSTFLRTILGQLPPLKGQVELGDNVQVGYFAQAHDQLRLDWRVLDEFLDHRPSSEQEARRYLGQYLFKGPDVFKKIGELSGGERGRLALAILAASGANFLLLDEPTNHLDIPAQEVLQEVLERFDGTILLVSHDRYLISHLATQIWWLEEQTLHTFTGRYDHFLAMREGKPLEVLELQSEAEVQAALLALVPPAEELQLEWVADLAPPPPAPEKKKKKPGRAEATALDLEIENAEIWLEKISQELETARQTNDPDQVAWLEEEYEEALQKLEELFAQKE